MKSGACRHNPEALEEEGSCALRSMACEFGSWRMYATAAVRFGIGSGFGFCLCDTFTIWNVLFHFIILYLGRYYNFY